MLFEGFGDQRPPPRPRRPKGFEDGAATRAVAGGRMPRACSEQIGKRPCPALPCTYKHELTTTDTGCMAETAADRSAPQRHMGPSSIASRHGRGL